VKETLKVLPLGGLGEIGMNLMVIQYGKDAVIVDCGIMFSDEKLPGIDLVVPDFSYILDESINLKAVLLTHGHEDHIGALPFLLRQREVPIYGSRFTLALVKVRLKEHGLLQNSKLHLVKEGDRIDLKPFNVEFIRMSHSIADALALAIRTPEGMIVHTGDFKIDPNPADGRTTDLERFQELGDEGVFLLMSDSTNVEHAGPSVSESSVRKDLEKLIAESEGWVVIACFASHIPRLKQVVEIAREQGKRIHAAGRTMIQNIGIARELGYLDIPDDLLVEPEEIHDIPRKKLVILSTGTQGEVRSALARMALNQHKELVLRSEDRIVMSSRFIPGNERAIFTIINHLYRRGSQVFTTRGADVHVSGHAYRGDLERMLKTVRPKNFIPVHGEYRHLVMHSNLAKETGVKSENVFLLEDGYSVEFSDGRAYYLPPIELNEAVVDGKDLVSIGSHVLRDRRHMSATGMIVAVLILDRHSGGVMHGPELFSKGLVVGDDDENLLDEIKERLEDHIEELDSAIRADEAQMQEQIRVTVRRFFKNRTDRKPVVIPIVLEV
jgi:ribonuclease J